MHLTLVLRLLKSWEYKNRLRIASESVSVLRLLKSWEYKNLKSSFWVFILYKNYNFIEPKSQSLSLRKLISSWFISEIGYLTDLS